MVTNSWVYVSEWKIRIKTTERSTIVQKNESDLGELHNWNRGMTFLNTIAYLLFRFSHFLICTDSLFSYVSWDLRRSSFRMVDTWDKSQTHSWFNAGTSSQRQHSQEFRHLMSIFSLLPVAGKHDNVYISNLMESTSVLEPGHTATCSWNSAGL